MGIIIKALLGLFIWLILGQILCKQFKFKKNKKTFVNIAGQIVGILMVVSQLVLGIGDKKMK